MPRRVKHLVVFSHKDCWPSHSSPSGYATDGGFPLQMQFISDLFDRTTLVLPSTESPRPAGEMPLLGRGLVVRALTPIRGTGWRRKLRVPIWLMRNFLHVIREFARADAVHAPIPGDVGTIGMFLAIIFRRPLLVRYCGNWFVQRTLAEKCWKWIMERFGGGRNVMLATGASAEPPSANPKVRWIFSTTLTESELGRCVPRPRGAVLSGRLIIVCRQAAGKGTDRLISSLPLILAEFPGATLDVVGDGPALSSLRRLAESLDVSTRVSFRGKQPHDGVLKLLHEADLFCYPTDSEGFPKVVVEAMSCGLPVITTRVSCLPTLLAGGAGLLLDDTTPEAIADAVTRCLSEPNVYEQMSRHALATARRYSLEGWRSEIKAAIDIAWTSM